jgi:hypothetical protein
VVNSQNGKREKSKGQQISPPRQSATTSFALDFAKLFNAALEALLRPIFQPKIAPLPIHM